MNPPPPNLYQHHRFLAEMINHGVWLSFRFCLSYRDVEEPMAERGVILTDEAVRYGCRKLGQAYVNQLCHRRPKPGDTWHLDEMLLTINKEHHDLWRAVDQDGHVLDILGQCRRDKKPAKKFFRKLLKGLTMSCGPSSRINSAAMGQPRRKSFRVWNIASSAAQQPCQELAPTNAPAGTRI